MIITRIEHPWKHLIIDNFLSENEFTSLIEYVKSVYDFPKNVSGYKEIHRQNSNTFVSDLFTPKIYKLKEDFFDELNYGNKILPEKYYAYSELVICPPNYRYGRIHPDAPEKLMTAVFYVYPEEGDGTEIYKTEYRNSYVNDVEWKQNRALVFVGQTNNAYQKTWHDYRNSKRNPRVTFNLNLTKNEIIKPYT